MRESDRQQKFEKTSKTARAIVESERLIRMAKTARLRTLRETEKSKREAGTARAH